MRLAANSRVEDWVSKSIKSRAGGSVRSHDIAELEQWMQNNMQNALEDITAKVALQFSMGGFQKTMSCKSEASLRSPLPPMPAAVCLPSQPSYPPPSGLPRVLCARRIPTISTPYRPPHTSRVSTEGESSALFAHANA